MFEHWQLFVIPITGLALGVFGFLLNKYFNIGPKDHKVNRRL